MGFLSLIADVLFVGHSLVGPDLPPLLEATLKRMGEPAVVEAQVIDGASLAYNWDHPDQAQGVDARARLAERPADVLILTEALPIRAAVAGAASAENVARFAGLALAANPRARVLLYETWPSRNSGPGIVNPDDPDAATPWRERLDQDLPVWEGVVRAAAATGVPVALLPAGQAMAALDDAIAAGAVPGVSDIGTFFADDIHPNDKGWYFLALVQAAAVTGKSPVGLPAKLLRSWPSREAVISDDLAPVLQRIAWEAVQGYVPAAAPPPLVPATAAEPVADMPAATAAPPAPAPQSPVFAPVTNPGLSLNLSGLSDWAVNQPFLNVMKTARPWVGHKPGQWGGWEHDDLAAAGALGPNGWPTRIPPDVTSIATLLLTDLPPDAGGLAGRYVLTYQGNGALELGGRAEVAEASPGRILFDFTPGEGPVMLTIRALDPGDPIRDIVVVRADREAMLAGGAMFNPDWLARIRGVRAIRLMNWMETNDSRLARLADRPQPGDYTYARKGAPIEVLVALANELQANPWFCIPHLAEDDLVRFYAQTVHDGLDPALVASVEFSNEVWNWQFAQAKWAEAQGRARWGKDNTWVQYYGLRAAEVAGIWAEEFKDAPARLQRIVAVQTGWLGLEQDILDAPLFVAEGGTPPGTSFDAYAVTGYVSAMLGSDQKAAAVRGWLAQSQAAAEAAAAAAGLTGTSAADHVAAHRLDLADQLAAQELRDGSVTGDAADSLTAVLTEVLPYHAAIAADRGLKLVMYEGGSHVVGYGAQVDDAALTEFFIHFNYTPEMAAIYADLMAGWATLTDQPFNAFVDVYRPGKWGSWGALRHLWDDNPRWQVLAKGCAAC